MSEQQHETPSAALRRLLAVAEEAVQRETDGQDLSRAGNVLARWWRTKTARDLEEAVRRRDDLAALLRQVEGAESDRVEQAWSDAVAATEPGEDEDRETGDDPGHLRLA